MLESLRQLVRDRAGDRCEYCRLPQHVYPPRFHVEHVRARSHGGTDEPENLALACPRCNRTKGPNLSAIDPITGRVVAVFNPRQQDWAANFVFDGPTIVGITSIGRATVELLRMNDEERLNVRRNV